MFKFLVLLFLVHIHFQLSLFGELHHSMIIAMGLKLCSLILIVSEIFILYKIVFERAFERVESP